MTKFVIRLLELIAPVITPSLREALKGSVIKLNEHAKSTPNEYDDIFVGILAAILGIDLP